MRETTLFCTVKIIVVAATIIDLYHIKGKHVQTSP